MLKIDKSDKKVNIEKVENELKQVLNLTKKLKYLDLSDTSQEYHSSIDLINELSASIVNAKEKLAKIISNILKGGNSLFQLSKDISSVSKSTIGKIKTLNKNLDELEGNSDTMKNNSYHIEESIADLNKDIKVLSEASTNSSSYLDSVASSTEEMSVTVNEISTSTSNTREIVGLAVESGEKASQRINELQIAVKDISDVTGIITDISNQTKLLALNATIEAARAGEAGKGFAVVASEIKVLANKTNTATTEIKEKVSSIEAVTQTTITEIEEIKNVIYNINEVVESIASSVEEQAVATSGITSNIFNVTADIKKINNSIQNTSLSIDNINKKVKGNKELVDFVTSSIKNLRKISKEFKKDSVGLYFNGVEVKSKVDDFIKIIQEINLPSSLVKESQKLDNRFFVYDDNWTVKVESLDEEHAEIFNKINILYKNIKEGEPRKVILETIIKLTNYTKQHFAREETLMKQVGSLELKKQKLMHTELLKKLDNIIKDLRTDKEIDYISVLIFAKDWLQNHILEEDKKYSNDMNEGGVY